MSKSTNTPKPGTGPDTTLNLSDPTSVLMLVSGIAGTAAAVWPTHESSIKAMVPLVCAIIISVGVMAKHHLAGALAKAVAIERAGVSASKAEGASSSSDVVVLANDPSAAKLPSK